MKNGKNVLFKKINKIKNLVYLMIILILMISTIYAEDSDQNLPTVIVVNDAKKVITNFLIIDLKISAKAIFDLNSDSKIDFDESYWAEDIQDWNPGESLIKKKSEKMAEQFIGTDYFKNETNNIILLGFSQGGLRVRSMAQYIAKNYPDIAGKKIKGIITLDSPNFGGAIANKANAKSLLISLGNTAVNTTKVVPGGDFLSTVLSIIFMGTEEQDSFNKINFTLNDFYEKNMPDFMIKEKGNIGDKLNNLEDEKAIMQFAQDTGLNLLENMIKKSTSDIDITWFMQILRGALESNDVSENVKKITSEFRPGSNFLNELNSAENVTKYEYSYKRAALIGTNGDLYKINEANNFKTDVIKTLQQVATSYLSSASVLLKKYWWNPAAYVGALYFFMKYNTTQNVINDWNNVPKKFNYWVTGSYQTYEPNEPNLDRKNKSTMFSGNANNFSHDLLITSENQKLPEYNNKASTYYEFIMSSINHIVPSAGVGKIIPSLQDSAKKQIQDGLQNAYFYCKQNNEQNDNQEEE